MAPNKMEQRPWKAKVWGLKVPQSIHPTHSGRKARISIAVNSQHGGEENMGQTCMDCGGWRHNCIGSDALRRRRLIPLIKAEMDQRERERETERKPETVQRFQTVER